jgi:hypothetical protein
MPDSRMARDLTRLIRDTESDLLFHHSTRVYPFDYEQFTPEQREAVARAHPRGPSFKRDIIDAFDEGIKYRPYSTFGTVNDEVLAFKDSRFQRTDFCKVILASA